MHCVRCVLRADLKLKLNKSEVQLFDKFTHTYLCTRRTHKGLKGTVVNRALPSVHGGSLKITLTVSLSNCTFKHLPF